MNEATLTVALAFAQLLVQYGVPAAIDAIQAWKGGLAGEPTPEDIQKLHDLVQKPETYF